MTSVRRSRLFLLLLLSISHAHCKPGVRPPPLGPEDVARSAAEGDSVAAVEESIRAALDSKVDPCQDFYAYACGGWTETNSDRVWTRAYKRTLVQRWQLLEDAQSSPTTEPLVARLREYHVSCLDRGAAQLHQHQALKLLIDAIDAVRDLDSFMRALAELQHSGIDALFSLDVLPDPHDPLNRLAPEIGGSILSFQERELYLQDSALASTVRRSSILMMRMQLERTDDLRRNVDADVIYDFETRLAQITPPRAQLHQPRNSLSSIDAAGLAHIAPSIAWLTYIDAAGFAADTRFTVYAPQFLAHLDKLLTETRITDLQGYLWWRLLATFGDLPDIAKRARWGQCAIVADNAVPGALARQYKAKYVSAATETAVRELAERVRQAMLERLTGNDWASAAVHRQVIEKVEQLVFIIGHTVRDFDYASLSLDADDLVRNVLAGNRAAILQKRSRIGAAVDRNRPAQSPFAPSASYAARVNQVLIPFGSLQAPVFSLHQPEAVRFGALGYVIAHETAHAIDGIGRNFDAQGGAAQPWDKQTLAELDRRRTCVSQALSSLEAAPQLYLRESAVTLPVKKVAVEQTLDENTADSLGLQVALAAFESRRQERGDISVSFAGFNEQQLFFIGLTQLWCANQSDADAQYRATFDRHTPGAARVNGLLGQIPQFAAAFGCAPRHPAAEPACQVW